jgi:hypothetical protein
LDDESDTVVGDDAEEEVAEEEREGETLATPYYTSRFDEHV